MGYKSRGNYSFGKCLDTCECVRCRGNNLRTKSKYESVAVSKSVGAPGLVVNTYFAPDGSVLNKPMSQTYIQHIRGRSVGSLHKLKKNMGAYGA
jgi:hypothetical protein